MRHTTIVGLQWGDEGKGKIVDYLADGFDIVVRFQGGDNAGHTIVVDGVTHKLSLIPSSILRPNKISVIGSGVVLNPVSFLSEVGNLKKMGYGIDNGNLVIAENVSLVLSVHRDADIIFEKLRGDVSIGTTRRGIGPCYEDKVGRRGIRLCDLVDQDSLCDKLTYFLQYHNILRNAVGMQPVTTSALMLELSEYKDSLLHYAKPTWQFLHEMYQSGKRIMFEGAQGIMLDIEHGTYPFVTSSSTMPSQAVGGTGIGFMHDKIRVIGVTKSYTTRVGNGVFPTEQFGEIGEKLFSVGQEIGTVSGRRRRCGWLDIVMLRRAILMSGASELIVTKLDVLDGFEKIKICTAYEQNHEIVSHFPTVAHAQKTVIPVYEELSGWNSSIRGLRNSRHLPMEVTNYIRRIEELAGIPVNIISTGPSRDDIIKLK